MVVQEAFKSGAGANQGRRPYGLVIRLLVVCIATFALPGGGAAIAPVREPVTALAFAPEGKALLSGGYGRVCVRLTTGGAPRTIKVSAQQVRDLAFHPSGRWLVAAGGSPGTQGVAELLEWPSGTSLRSLREHRDVVHAAAFNPAGTLLATAGADRVVQLYTVEMANGVPALTPLQDLEGHSGPVLTLAFSPDGKLLLTAGVDRSIRVWDPEARKLLRVFTNHLDTVHALAFAPAGGSGGPAYCASASEDRTVRVWQPEIGRMVRILRGFEGPVLDLAYSRDREQLFCADNTGTVRAFDASSDHVLRSWKAHPGWIYRLTMNPAGSRLATGDWAGSVKLWDPATGYEAR